MLNNYRYFITLAEELSISRAAEKLFISHQSLSKYLKNLENEYRLTLFERVPVPRLTLAGKILLEMFRNVQSLELNLQSQFDDIRDSRRGVIRLGTTEGRYRILIPKLMAQYRKLYPEVELDVRYATSDELAEALLRNEMDIVILNKTFVTSQDFEVRTMLDEKLFLVISDNMLKRYFPEQYPQCVERFRNEGVDLASFCEIPFVLNTRKFNSRLLLDSYALEHGTRLKCAMELTQLDVHFQLAAYDYAACFCWTMYIPIIHKMNKEEAEHHLNIFSLRDGNFNNQFVCAYKKGKMLPKYGQELINFIRKECESFSVYNPQ